MRMAPRKTRVRLVSSRGHLYAQEVRYEWDRTRQRGITQVIRTLGPMAPLRRPSVGGLDPTEIWLRLELQKKDRSQTRARPPPSKMRLASTENAKLSGASVIAEEADPQSAGTSRGRRSLTGIRGVESFDQRVLEFVCQSNGEATRATVFEAVKAAGIPRPNHRQSLRRHVSFALTRLFRQRTVTRTGSGGRGNPYQYNCRPQPPIRCV